MAVHEAGFGMRPESFVRLLLTVVCVAAVPLVAQQSPARRVTSTTGGSRAGIDVLHYTFRVEFPATGVPDTIRITTTAQVWRTAAVTALSLDLVAAMHVDSVRVNTRAAHFTRPGDSVRVELPAGTGDTLTVAVFHHGAPSDGLVVRRDSSGWTAFGDNFPDRARQWLAVVDHPSDKALVEWDVLAPSTHRVIANGLLVAETPEVTPTAARRVRTRWRTLRPIYPSVMVIGVAPFAVLDLGDTACGLGELPGCVRQSVWTAPSQRAVLPGNFARAGDIVAFFSKLVGPFPYEKLAHVASSTRFGGMENAAAIFYDGKMFSGAGPKENLIAHETAHQWFGDAVTEREWPHVWLSEGFATYFAALWTEHAHGDSAFRAERIAMRARVLAAPITMEKAVIDETLTDVRKVLNSNVYQKAGFVLHMLRTEIGDSAFFGGIRSYYAAHRHRTALTSDLQAQFERAAGRPLDWFFEQWMRRPGFAELTTSWRWDASRALLIVQVVQGQRVAPFRLSLSMDVLDAGGATQRLRLTIPATATSSIEVPLPGGSAPTRVVFDADASIMGTVSTR